MKRILIVLINSLLFTATCVAQKKLPAQNADTISRVIKNLKKDLQISASTIVVPGVDVYEKPNYQGRKAPFTKNAEGKFEFPFPVTRVSIKIPDNLILYIKTCFEFSAEGAYIRDIPSISLADICGVRTDEQVKIEVAVGGISTEIHNNDCKRIKGTVEARVYESGLPGEFVEAISMPLVGTNTFSGRSAATPFTQIIYHPQGYPTSDRTYDVNQFYAGAVFNNNPMPIILRKAPAVKPEYEIKGHFVVGKTALRDGRVRVMLKTDLVSEHKSCDLCTDYNSDVRMQAPVTETIPINKTYGDRKIINAAHPAFILGPYQAVPYKYDNDLRRVARDPNTTLVKNLRVHLIVIGL